MPSRYRLGLLGCARIVDHGFAAGVIASQHAQLAACASRSEARARRCADMFGIPRVCASYEELLNSPDIDAVYVPLPNALHREWTIAAAAAGKHVLCEKPLALDAAEARAMADACARRGVVLMEAFMWRHHPRVRAAAEAIARGAIGAVRTIDVQLSFRPPRADWRLTQPLGGGVEYDLGVYGIDIGRFFCGAEPDEFVVRHARWRRGVLMAVVADVAFPGGTVVALDCRFELPLRNSIRITGTSGVLEFPGGVLPDARGTLVLRGPAGDPIVEEHPGDQYAAEVDAFCQALDTGALQPPCENGVAAAVAMDRLREAARMRRRRWWAW